jgi:hypothetical protein
MHAGLLLIEFTGAEKAMVAGWRPSREDLLTEFELKGVAELVSLHRWLATIGM